MAQSNIDRGIIIGASGMNRDSHFHQLDQNSYTFQNNGRLDTIDGFMGLTNEPSNILCSNEFKDYIVVGHKYDQLENRVWLFLAHREQGIDGKRHSKIGYIDVGTKFLDEQDVDLDCGCNALSILDKTPLEDLENHVAHCKYNDYLVDCKESPCLNFDPNYPIVDIILKQESCGSTMTWVSGNMPPRYIVLDRKDDYYIYKGDKSCGEDNRSKTDCIDCDKLLLFPAVEIPNIEVKSVALGGNLRRGIYEFYVAYCDKLGNELSDYFAATNPVAIFDKNNNVLDQSDRFSETNYSIELRLRDLDRRYNYYKIVAVERADVSHNVSVFVEGIHNIGDTKVLYLRNGDGEGKVSRMTMERLFAIRPIYKKFGGLSMANGMLFGYDYEVEKEWNLQPVVNLLGTFLKWQTLQGNENLYQDGVNTSLYKGYMRDEVYPIGIRFVTNKGYKTSVFPLIGRPPLPSDTEIVNNIDVKSVNEESCNGEKRDKRWQLYNTAKVLGENRNYDNRDISISTEIRDIEKVYAIDNFKRVDSGRIEMEVDPEFSDLKSWIKNHYKEIHDTSSKYYNADLVKILSTSDMPDLSPKDAQELFSTFVCEDKDECVKKYCDTNSEYYDEQICNNIKSSGTDSVFYGNCYDVEKVLGSEESYIYDVLGDTVVKEYKRLPTEAGDAPIYEHNRVDKCSDWESDNNSIKLLNFDESGESEIVISEIKKRSNSVENTTCKKATSDDTEGITFDIDYTAKIEASYDFWSKGGNSNCNLRKAKVFSIYGNKYDNITYKKSIEAEYSKNDQTGCHFGHKNIASPSDWVFDKSNLLTDVLGGEISGFEKHIHTKALWYAYDLTEDFIFEVTPNRTGLSQDMVSKSSVDVRVTILDGCKGKVLFSDSYNSKDGYWKRISRKNFLGIKKIWIALDTPLKTYVAKPQKYNVVGGDDYDGNVTINREMISTQGVAGCFSVYKRPLEAYKTYISYDSIIIGKQARYKSKCVVPKPLDEKCGFVGHKYGYFSYWQSTESYSDNAELYDSSKLKFGDSFLSKLKSIEDKELVDLFKSHYLDIPENLKFCKKFIRHFKFPDNVVAPFMSVKEGVAISGFEDSMVYPLGITISEETINLFLDLAEKSCLISSEQRHSVVGYELFRGDRTGDSSIIMKGILHDMYKDTSDKINGSDVYFRNFPYNTLGDNIYLTSSSVVDQNIFERIFKGGNIPHPFNSLGNNKFSFVAPEIYDQGKSVLPSEMSIDGYMFGQCDVGISPTKDHAEWVILGNKAWGTASVLAAAEVAVELAMTFTAWRLQRAQTMWDMNGESTSTTTTASEPPVKNKHEVKIFGNNSRGEKAANLAIYIGMGVVGAQSVVYKIPQLAAQWLDIFQNMGTPKNFAHIVLSTKGNYNRFMPLSSEGTYNGQSGNKVRRIKAKHLGNGLMTTFDSGTKTNRAVVINNKDREDSVYIRMNDMIYYPSEYINYDNASNPSVCSRVIASTIRGNNIRNIASPYVSLRNYVPDQYGKIDSVKWISLNHNNRFLSLAHDGKNGKCIFGGDIFISRVDLKNKVSLFNVTGLNLANRTPFKYSLYSNIGNVKYYVDAQSGQSNGLKLFTVPYAKDGYHLDDRDGISEFYVSGKFYTHVFGIPYFLVESTINCNYRYAGKEFHEQFASRGIDVEAWCQPSNVSMAFENRFKYNNIYSMNQFGLPSRVLPEYYEKEKWDCIFDADNGVAWSEPDYSEVSLSDPWLIWRPFNIYRFPFNYGKLIGLNAIESTQVIGRFENNMVLFNAIDTLRDRINSENEVNGTGGIFAQRPISFSHTELGGSGSQHKAFVSCDYGHFWVDSKRGKVFHLQPNGQGLTPISERSGSKMNGMGKWFKNHLPFKILRGNIQCLKLEHLDKAIKGLGIILWWDQRMERLFLTKRDYIPLVDNIVYVDGEFYYDYTLENSEKYPKLLENCDECDDCVDCDSIDNCGKSKCVNGKRSVNQRMKIELTDNRYFEDVSFTISYSPIYGSWLSYHDFKPNYAIGLLDHFKTGINYSADDKEIGIWSHLLTHRSYQVYYGKKYPWEIRLPIKNNYVNNILSDVKIWGYSQRYHDNFDYAIWRKRLFNKAMISNQTNNSGLLRLSYEDNYKKSDYPKYISEVEQMIPVTHHDDYIRINYFYNRVLREDNHVPIFQRDKNDIYRSLNPQAISFSGKRLLERLRGDWFELTLINDVDTQFSQVFKWGVYDELKYL